MKNQTIKLNQVNFTEHIDCDLNTSQNHSNSLHQFKLFQLQQQNQSLGDYSQSLMQFPTQTLFNNAIKQDSKIQNDVQNEIQDKQCSSNNSFENNQKYQQCFEYNSNFTIHNGDIQFQIPQVDQQMPQQNKKLQAQSIFYERQSLTSANQTSSLFTRYDKSKAINFQNAFDSKEANKTGLKQKGYKKRNNLLARDNNAQKEVWKKKWFLILALVSKMKKAAQQSSLFFRPQNLREIQIRLINDLSTINFVASLILFVYLPFEYCFGLSRGQFFRYFISYFCTIIFSADIFVKFNTVSSEQGNPIEQHMQIFTNYISTTFLFDLICLLSLNSTIFYLDGISFLFFLRIFQPFRILELFREQFLLKTKIFGVISLLYLLAQVIYFAHLFTCLWNYVGLLQLEQNTGWIVTYNYQTESVSSRYIQTFYYAVVTMTTIGYGDFTAQTKLEKLLMIFIAFFSCGIFGYTINSIGNILYDFKQKRDLYLQELAKINKYFKQNNVELGLQCRAKKYIQYIYSDQYCDQSCSIKSLSSLSVYLQKEIQQDVYIKMLKKVPIFREIITEQIFNELALLMKEKIVCHDQLITCQEEDDEGEHFIYFVNDGTILEFCQYDSKTQIKEIQKFRYGQYFGLAQFMSGNSNQNLKYKSIGVSSVLQLSNSNFIEVLRKYDLEYQKFCQAKDEVKFESKFQKINSYCYSCKQKNHRFEECPYLFYEGKKPIILRQYIKENNFKIKHFQRKKQDKSLNALISQEYVAQCADKHFLQNMPCFSMWYESQESGSQSDSKSNEKSTNSSQEHISQEIIQQEIFRNANSEQRLGESKKIGSIIEDSSQMQLNGRKFSLQIQKEIQNQFELGETNQFNIQKVNSSFIPSKINILDDEESINLEENLNNQIYKNKKSRSYKNIHTKDSFLNIQNLHEYDQFNSQSKINVLIQSIIKVI
ncbi:cation channel family protein (macronuclear) [Tetrahymena thermophila SB210]|uniref:Cation channel family protein n=1 Tax=Tetrahymena thermophila (strain SB210) TaxID=312017 RepID=Q232U7_TETTS|nr:cation channel family protein [Tetrahymena thermophila SB210]EAR91733.2 cation channel family protein [Tetrahymena thermophila SB210]|eukprot:XP_001011978.2 cation channel family protein [Tetrahymena thermophila SB210]